MAVLPTTFLSGRCCRLRRQQRPERNGVAMRTAISQQTTAPAGRAGRWRPCCAYQRPVYGLLLTPRSRAVSLGGFSFRLKPGLQRVAVCTEKRKRLQGSSNSRGEGFVHTRNVNSGVIMFSLYRKQHSSADRQGTMFLAGEHPVQQGRHAGRARRTG